MALEKTRSSNTVSKQMKRQNVQRPHTNIFGITGTSGSGKTTLMAKLLPELKARGLSVSTVKLSHHDIDLDQPGKDSHIHRMAGAKEVMLASRNRWTLFHEHEPGGTSPDIATLTAQMKPVDLILVEGRRACPLGKLEVHRPGASRELFCKEDDGIVAVASDGPIADLGVPLIDLNDIAAIADFVMQRMERGA